MNLDSLNDTDFWNLVYKTAKNRKAQKKQWADFMSPEHVTLVRDMASNHVSRIQREINRLVRDEGYSESDPQIVRMGKARTFIQGIFNAATHSMEEHVAANRNIRKYAKIQDLIAYAEYLKDCLEDLSEYTCVCNGDETLDFPLHVTFESWKTDDDDNQTQLDEWVAARKARRETR